MQIVNALPLQWRKSLTSCGQTNRRVFVFKDQVKLRFKNKETLISKAVSKDIYSGIRSKFETASTAQGKYMEQFLNVDLNWQEIYNLPFKVLIDSREFQYRILHRFLTTSSFLYKIGLIASPLCTFCGLESEWPRAFT